MLLYSKKSVIRVLFWSIAYVGISTFLLNYFSGSYRESTVWIPAGIGLGVLLVFGLRYWPFIFIAATFGEISGAHSALMAMQLATGSVLSFIVAAILLERYLKFDLYFESLQDYGRLLFASAIAATVSTSINTQMLVWGGLVASENLFPIYLRWFKGDLFGLAFVSPIFLVLNQSWLHIWTKQKKCWFIFSISIAFLLGQAIFFGWFKEFIDLTGRGFFLIFITAYFGFYFGRYGALIFLTLTIMQALLGAIHGDGYFGADLLSRPARQYIEFYLGTLCGVGILISLAVKNFKSQNQALEVASGIASESAKHFQMIVSSLPILMSTYDVINQKTDYVNPFFSKVLGYTQDDLNGTKSWWEMAYPAIEYRTQVKAEWQRRVTLSKANHGLFEDFETETTAKNGSLHQISWGCFSSHRGMVIYGQDFTEQRKAGKILEMTSTLFQAMGDSVVISDASNHIIMANESFKKQFGYQDEDLVDCKFSDLLVKRVGSRSYSDIFISLEAMGRWEGQARIRTKTDEDFLKFVSIYSTFDHGGQLEQRVALISNVTNQRKARELINQQANFDPLTGLPNRRLMFDRLDHLIKASTHSQSSIAIAYIDLDHFKDINDGRGHDFGDQLLKGVANRLRSLVRETDTVARMGGDEFVILLGDLETPDVTETIMQEVSKGLANPIEIDMQQVHITASIGISIYPNDGVDAKSLLLSADQAMYAAKAQDRNNYQYFTQTLQITASYRAGITNELRTALANNQFELYYQPIVNLATGKTMHAEALLRWRRLNGELILPSAFIHIAEESGLILGIGDWVWKESLKFLSSLKMLPDLKLAINVSASQFNSNQHSTISWLELMRQYDVSPNSIVLEITERMMLNKTQRVLRKITMLQEAGCLFSVDDFGTGYSSLASLKSFNFDSIKIDMNFIKPLRTGSRDASLVFAMISMVEALGLESIAEGVETAEQAQLLREMNCTYAQGYFYSKPLSAEAFKAFMLSSNEPEILLIS